MYNYSIPDEYILEEDAYYDESRFKMHIMACLATSSYKKIYDGHNNLFRSFFRSNTHKDIAFDILKFVMDKEDVSEELITRRLIRGMYDSGFFG